MARTRDRFKTESDKKKVFLSYSSADAALVHRLANDLSSLGISTWLDAWEIRPGDSLRGRIGRGLVSAEYFAFAVSRSSVASEWCMNELHEALALEQAPNRHRVIPLVIETVELPPFLRDRAYIDFRSNYDQGVARLGAHLNGIDQRTTAELLIRFTDALRESSDSDSMVVLRDFVADEENRTRHIGAEEWKKLVAALAVLQIPVTGSEIRIRDPYSGREHRCC